MTIISPPTPLWSPTSGDGHLLPLDIELSLFLLNRAMLNNERDYPEPHEFKPERFLKNGELDSSVKDPMEIIFGFGRRWALFILSISPMSHRLISGRICPGRHLAHSTLTLAAASVLSTFDLVKKVDKNGREIQPMREYTKTAIRLVPIFSRGFLGF